MVAKFWNWLQRNFNTRGTLAVIVISTICYMAATAMAIPSELWSIATFILGFYFGARTMVGTARTRG
jgi:hypothetical protein